MTWPTALLREVATIERSSVSPSDIRSGSRYIGLEHIESGGGSLSFGKVANGELASSKFRFGPEHILFGKLRPYLAKIVAPGFSGICSTDILPILPTQRVDKRYLLHFLRLPRVVDWASSRSTGVNLPRLSPSELATLEIPLPPLPEQRRIAAILDKADELRRKRKRAIELLDSLTQSIFLEMFGDPALNPFKFPMKTFRQFSIAMSDGPFGSNLKSEHYVESGVRVIRLQNIGVGEFKDGDRAFITEKHFHKLSKHTCLPGDILVGTLGDPNLRACIQPKWLELAINKADCVQIRAKQGVALPEYIVALINQPATEKMAAGIVLGQTRSRISMGRLRELSVPIAPIGLQKRFVDIIRSKAKEAQGVFSAANSLELLFSSLQSRAFSGQL